MRCRMGPAQRGGAFAPYKRFGPWPKTLAQAELTSAEQCNHRSVEASFGHGNSKKKVILSDDLLFWYG